ncbi:MAG: DNA-processing protein DprA, partial [Oscillospiraceae bacterium]|nr:DNA-processing protein DprA [Oscillospiraceae bacterium]
MSALTYWLWLAGVPALGAGNAARLLDDFGSPEAVYFADPAEFENKEITAAARAGLLDKSTRRVDGILEKCDALGIHILTLQDALYPDRLKQIYDPPAVLYVMGKLAPLDETPLLTVVGSRTYTPYGEDVARRMGYQLAKAGMAVVSGMAKGIDGCAMRGALKAEGLTVAVLGCGADVVYPQENRALYEQIRQTGMIITEYPPGTPAASANFPVRNRIMAAISMGTLVIEAGARSGALITARLANDYGRDVFCVPGSIVTPESAGCHELIKAGAALVTNPADILREYIPLFPHKLSPPGTQAAPSRISRPESSAGRGAPPKPSAERAPLPADLSENQRLILLSLADAPRIADDIVAATGLAAAEVLGELTLLEIQGLVETLPGKRF